MIYSINHLFSRPGISDKDTRNATQVLNQYHAAAPPFVCVTLVRIGRSANVREFSLLVRNPSVVSAISMFSHFWNICRVMSSPDIYATEMLKMADKIDKIHISRKSCNPKAKWRSLFPNLVVVLLYSRLMSAEVKSECFDNWSGQ